MKIAILALSLLTTSMSFAAEKPRVGEFDPTQCGCETCFTNYGVCTAVNQGNDRKDVTRSQASNRNKRGSKVRGQ